MVNHKSIKTTHDTNNTYSYEKRNVIEPKLELR